MAYKDMEVSEKIEMNELGSDLVTLTDDELLAVAGGDGGTKGHVCW